MDQEIQYFPPMSHYQNILAQERKEKSKKKKMLKKNKVEKIRSVFLMHSCSENDYLFSSRFCGRRHTSDITQTSDRQLRFYTFQPQRGGK